MTRPLACLLLAASALSACQKAEPPRPSRPPGEVYSGPNNEYLFIRPAFWLRQVLPQNAAPAVDGASAMVRWHLNVEDAAAPTVLTLYTFTPAAWGAVATPDSVGTVVFQDAQRVIVAGPADPNPYAPADSGYAHYEHLVIPPDSVRARILVR